VSAVQGVMLIAMCIEFFLHWLAALLIAMVVLQLAMGYDVA
jgi:hypothetical protein